MSYDLQPLWLSIRLASVTTLVLFIISIPFAYWLNYGKNSYKSIFHTLVKMPLVLPPSVLGFYLLLAFSPEHFFGHFLDAHFHLRLVFSFSGLVLASVLFSLPFMVDPLHAGFAAMPKNYLEAASVLGKTPLETLWHVLLPNMKPALLSGIVLTFAHTLGEFGVVLMIGGNIPGQTRVASIAIFDEVESLNFAAANFYAMVLFVFSFVLLMLVYQLNRKWTRTL